MPHTFKFKTQIYDLHDQETCLEAFHRHGLLTPFSCQKGICGTCILRALPGQAPLAAQKGLDPRLQEKGYFLPCICIPTQNLDIGTSDKRDLEIHRLKVEKALLETSLETPSRKKDLQRAKNGELCDPPPDPEMWAALQKGQLLKTILSDFYTQVYADPELYPFFEGVTKQHAIEKQYNFLYQIFTGQQVYFGEKPKTGHHWMVISEDLMTRREEMMAQCLRAEGLSEVLIQRWRDMEERYRIDIVKSEPWEKEVFGEKLPVDGYDELELSIGAMCDHCEKEVKIGETVRYHLRLGTISCPTCMKN